MPVLYRAVSEAEYADMVANGAFRASGNSCEGKHFADSVSDARRWGEQLFGSAGFTIVETSVDDQALNDWYYWPKLDGIGPAYFADLDQLMHCLKIQVCE